MEKLFYHNYINDTESSLMFSYKGPFFDEVLGKLIDLIRKNFSFDPVVDRKIVSVFIELAQNIYHYSADFVKIDDKEYGIGCINITKEINNKFYQFTAGNFVSVEYVKNLEDMCVVLNTLNRDELRKLKRDTRSELTEANERSKGAGIGLIQIALAVNEPFEYEILPHNEEKSFFYISARVNNLFV